MLMMIRIVYFIVLWAILGENVRWMNFLVFNREQIDEQIWTIYNLSFVFQRTTANRSTHTQFLRSNRLSWMKTNVSGKCLMLKWIIELKITVTEEQNQNILYMKLKEKSQKYIHILN